MEIGLLVEPRLLSGVKLFLDVLEMEEQVRKLVWEVIFWRGFPLKCWAVTCCQLPITSTCCPQQALTNLMASVAETLSFP